MKQNLFLAALGCLALTACSQVDEVPETHSSRAIGFNGVVGKNTRAVDGDLTLNNFNNFAVYGYYTENGLPPFQIFDGDIVTRQTDADGNTTGWKYDNTRYWIPNAEYYFYAYSCADVALSNTYGQLLLNLNKDLASDRALEIQNYLVSADHQHDLIVAKNEGLKGQEKGSDLTTVNRTVAFTFEHALSKINIQFSSKFPKGYDITVSDVKLVGYYDMGTFDFDQMEWKNRTKTTDTNAGTNTSIDLKIPSGKEIIPLSSAVTKDPEEGKTASVFMLPMLYDKDDANNTSATVELLFTIKMKQGNNEYLVRNLKGIWQPQWKKGTAYQYTVELGGDEAQLEAIVFETYQEMNNASWGTTQSVKMNFSLQ